MWKREKPSTAVSIDTWFICLSYRHFNMLNNWPTRVERNWNVIKHIINLQSWIAKISQPRSKFLPNVQNTVRNNVSVRCCSFQLRVKHILQTVHDGLGGLAESQGGPWHPYWPLTVILPLGPQGNSNVATEVSFLKFLRNSVTLVAFIDHVAKWKTSH